MLRSPLRVSDDHLRFGGWGVHYAWIIVLLAATMWMISSSFRFAAVVLVPHLQDPVDGFGWSKWAIAIAFSLQWVISAVMSPVLGGLGERYGVRPILVLGAVLFLAGMVLCGYMTSLWQFYLYFGILLGIAMTVFQVPLVSSVTVWFRTNLGVAMGGMQALQSLGTVTMIPLIAVLFAGVGLSWTFWIPGIAGGVLLLLMIPPFFNEPAQAKMRPYGATIGEPVMPVQRDEETKIRNQVFFGEARRTHAFWNLIGIHFWGCMGHNIFIVFLVAMAQDVGVSASLAVASFVTLQSSSMISRFAVPIVADHIGAKNVMKVCFSLQVLPPILLLVTQDPWAFFVFAALFGIGSGGEVPLFPIINRQYFGRAPIGAVYGWEMLGNGFGMAIGPILGGLLLDFVSFQSAILMSIAFSAVGLISVVLLPATTRVLTPDWERLLPQAVRSSSSS